MQSHQCYIGDLSHGMIRRKLQAGIDVLLDEGQSNIVAAGQDISKFDSTQHYELLVFVDDKLIAKVHELDFKDDSDGVMSSMKEIAQNMMLVHTARVEVKHGNKLLVSWKSKGTVYSGETSTTPGNT